MGNNKIIEWLLNGNTGTSSETLCAAFCDLNYKRPNMPFDSYDFARCEGFMSILNEQEKEIALQKVLKISPEWAEIARRWKELCSSSRAKIDEELNIIRNTIRKQKDNEIFIGFGNK